MKKEKFDFGNANIRQKEAIMYTEGPLLISAGPGTGKTFTLVNRVIYLILEKKVLPENILIATFTEKAAKELLTRISNELLKRKIEIDTNEMYIGTFHSICMRIIIENIEYSKYGKNFTLLDSFDQQYLIYQNLWETFNKIPNIDLLLEQKSFWAKSQKLTKLFNGITEEYIMPEDLLKDQDITINILGKAKIEYDKLLKIKNCIDFSTIQFECLSMLENNYLVLKKYNSLFQYLMIDEYQDTNYIQERLIFLLSGERKNICVVGDDDQALYRFRGATIRNILEFSDKFKPKAKMIKLEENYRSSAEIVNFYNNWMQNTESSKYKFEWDNYRILKKINANKKEKINSVFKLSANGTEGEWHQSILNTIRDIKPNIKDYNQIAFLFNSVQSKEAKGLLTFLENNGIPVYSPRSNLFFERPEVKMAIGLLLIIFPQYTKEMDSGKFDNFLLNIKEYYLECLKVAHIEIKNDNELAFWLKEKILEHTDLKHNTDYAISGIFYQLLQFNYFKKYIEINLNERVSDQREIRNLSIISNLLAKFEYNENISVLTEKNMEYIPKKFFNNYLKFLKDGGIDEYQDEYEYAPSGCVSFLTIHQSKGMEFPIVFVGGLGGVPRNNSEKILNKLYNIYGNKDEFEPSDVIKFFDFWRLYYVAFSRAQDMLILTTNVKDGRGRKPSKYFADTYNKMIDFNNNNLSLISFNEVKENNLKNSYAFTSDVTLYENCSLQYKVYRKLGFSPVRVGATLFGSLVHQTIEDIHKTVLRGEINKINKENINIWFKDNYRTLATSQKSYLGEPQLKAAERQVLNYVKKNEDNFYLLKDAEVNVSLIRSNYILNGQIDLIEGKNNTYEIIDFKAEKKPDIFNERNKFDKYKKQLEIYAYLLEQKYNYNISKMHLYYTGSENENPRISFNKNTEVIVNTIHEFDEVVKNIQSNDFSKLSENLTICKNCDMRFYCNKTRKEK